MNLSSLRTRRTLAGAYLLVALIATWQRGIASRGHSTFAIFRQSYVHLVAGKDIYARYPAEQGMEPPDRFKYSPTAAVLFAPLSAFPYPVALLFWDLLNVSVLFYAVTKLLPALPANTALLVLVPEVFAAVQASSSNALVAGLMLLAIGWIIQERHARAAVMIGIGTAIKIFPLATAVVAVSRERRWRLGWRLALVGVAAAVLPLIVVDLPALAAQYRSWYQLEMWDARDLEFGASLIRTIRGLVATSVPNWRFQLAGLLLLLTPLLRRDAWSDERFLRRFGCSVLMFCVLFNHQAERQAFVIAAAGAALWLVDRPRSNALIAVLALALSGGSIIPYAVLWLALQAELLAEAPQRTWSTSIALVDGGDAETPNPCRCCGGAASPRRIACGTCRAIAPAWPLHRAPEVLASALLAAIGVDLLTEGHLLVPWSVWDLLS